MDKILTLHNTIKPSINIDFSMEIIHKEKPNLEEIVEEALRLNETIITPSIDEATDLVTVWGSDASLRKEKIGRWLRVLTAQNIRSTLNPDSPRPVIIHDLWDVLDILDMDLYELMSITPIDKAYVYMAD